MKPNTKLEAILTDIPDELKEHYIRVLQGAAKPEEEIPDFYTISQMKEELKGEPDLFIYSTGWKDLDRIAEGGIAEGEVVLCVAEAKAGKTHFAINMAANFARRRHPVFYLTMEDGYRLIIKRFDQMGFGPEVTDNVIIVKEHDVTLQNAIPILRKAVEDASLVIVDNLFSLPMRQTGKSDYWTSQAEWMDDLCNMIRSTKSCGMLMHHINKSKETGMPERYSIAGSTRLVNRASQVWMLHRTAESPRMISVKVEAHRRSPDKGICHLKSNGGKELFCVSADDLSYQLRKNVESAFGRGL